MFDFVLYVSVSIHHTYICIIHTYIHKYIIHTYVSKQLSRKLIVIRKMSIFHWFEMQTQNGSWYISWYSSWYSNWYSNWYSHLIKPPDTKKKQKPPEGFTTLTAFTFEFEGVVIQGLINHGCGSRLALNWCNRGLGVALGLWFRLWANDGDGVDAMVMTPLRVSLFFSLTSCLHQCSILAYICKMRFSRSLSTLLRTSRFLQRQLIQLPEDGSLNLVDLYHADDGAPQLGNVPCRWWRAWATCDNDGDFETGGGGGGGGGSG